MIAQGRFLGFISTDCDFWLFIVLTPLLWLAGSRKHSIGAGAFSSVDKGSSTLQARGSHWAVSLIILYREKNFLSKQLVL
jgi:hypothetical protein